MDTPPAADQGRQRIAAIDVLRGLVIVFMVLDHTREYTHASGYAFNPLEPSQTTPLIYATRWITHLCAPTFVFLSGVSIRLQAIAGLSGAKLARRLVTRGLWLILLELTVIGFAWSFSIPFIQLIQVIWAIGWSMILMAGLVFLPPLVSLLVGGAIVAASELLFAVDPASLGGLSQHWTVLFRIGFFPSPQAPLAFIAYPVIPWFGIMALGFGLGGIFVSPKRDRWLALIGLGMLALFLVLRLPNLYGDLRPWTPEPTLICTIEAVMNVSKNPPSLDFVLATLGVVLTLFPLLARVRGPVAGVFQTFGSVPLMAYVPHIYVMHLYATLARIAAGASLAPMTDTMRAFFFQPERFAGFSLPIWGTYLVWLAVVATIYPLCRWWQGVKRRRRDWWLSYL